MVFQRKIAFNRSIVVEQAVEKQGKVDLLNVVFIF